MSKNMILWTLAAVLLIPAASRAQAPGPSEWLTFGYDAQRSGWNAAETTLSPKNVGRLKLLWSTVLTTPPQDVALSTLTAPLVAAGVETAQGKKNLLFTVGVDDTIFAIDADSGNILWQKTFANPGKPLRSATTNCANTEQATPVIDKASGIIYFTTSDGKLRGLGLAAGEERLTPRPLVAPYSRNWSLNLIHNVVYTAAGRGCGGDASEPIKAGAVSAMDISDLQHPQLSRFQTGRGRPAGPWGRGGPVAGPKGVYVQTADGNLDPAAGFYAMRFSRWPPRPMASRIPSRRRTGNTSTPRTWTWARAGR
jgi:outer membrane protein assembly factor BamB